MAAIPGASSVEQLESNVAAADIELSDDEDRALRAASDGFQPITGRKAVPACSGPAQPLGWPPLGWLDWRAQPRPMNGMVVAVMVRNCTFASRGSPAM